MSCYLPRLKSTFITENVFKLAFNHGFNYYRDMRLSITNMAFKYIGDVCGNIGLIYIVRVKVYIN